MKKISVTSVDLLSGVSWVFNHQSEIFACVLDVVVPEIASQLFGCRGTIFVLVLVSASGLVVSVISRYVHEVLTVNSYHLPSNVLRDIDVNYGIALLDDPFKVVLLTIRLFKSAYRYKLGHFSRLTTQVL